MNTEVFDLGKIGITLGGEYNNKVIYEKLTIVLYKGKSYISTKTTQSISPEQDTLIWQLVAEAKDAYHMLVDAGKITLTEEEFLEQLVDATKGRYIVQGNITNAADEEDLTVEHSDLLGIDTLKLANRDNTNGMGYVILRKNKSFAEQVTKENTIYEIRYDFILNENSTIPANCILKFNGGSINGEYILTGNNTGIETGLVKIFNTDITLAGTWNVAEAYPEWFDAKGDGVTDDTAAIQKSLNSFKNIYFEGEYLTTSALNIGIACNLNSHNKKAIIHYTRINCISSQNVSLDGSSFRNICFDGDMACDGLLIKANNITIEGCTFKNIKATNNYSEVTWAISIGDYYSVKDRIIFTNIIINKCIFDRGEPRDTISMNDSNSTVSRFIVVNNGKDVKITNNIFKNLIGLKDSDCIQITGETESVDYFPYVGDGTWSGSSPGYIGTSYKYNSVFINKNIFYLNNTKSAIKIMGSGVSVVDNKFYVYSDYNSPVGSQSQYSVIRAHYGRNIEYLRNQIILQNIKFLESIFHLSFCYNCNVSNNSVSIEENSSWDIDNVTIFYLSTNDNVLLISNNITVKVKENCYITDLESNGTILFSNLNINVNYVGETSNTKNLHYWENHYIYPSNTKKGTVTFKDSCFTFTGTYSDLRYHCVSEKSFEFINCIFNTDNKEYRFIILSISDRNDVYNKFINIDGDVKLNIQIENNESFNTYNTANKSLIENINKLVYLLLNFNVEVRHCKFSETYGNHQIQLRDASVLLDDVEFQPRIIQIRSGNGNNICTVKNIFAKNYDVINTYIPSGTISFKYLKSTIYSLGLTKGSTANRLKFGTDIEPNFEYFDDDLNKPVWWNGTTWVDATGATL